MKRLRSASAGLSFALGLLLAAPAPAQAQAIVTYQFDEFGRGGGTGPGGSILLPGVLAFDPGPGGLASALTYSGLGNPPSIVAGDVLVFEPGVGNTLSDVIRFNAAGTGGNPAYLPSLVFYSDNSDGDEVPSLADTGFPIAFYANTVNVRETAISPNHHIITYTPLAGQPGFVAGFAVTYNLISSIPEPGPLVLGGFAVAAGLIAPRLRRKR
ncbi:MAG: hypothetical protein U0835_25085 [Isosphaeraceae bacterium]